MPHWAEEELIPIRSRVYTYLKNAIIKGEFKAGERLIERELASMLNISRTPIREALLRLESQGFVKTLPRKGVVVAEISHSDMLDIFTILSELEVLAVKFAVQKMTPQTQEEIRELIKQIDDVLEEEQEYDSLEFHMEIQKRLYKAAKSPKLYEILSGLIDYIYAFSKVGHERPGRMKKSLEEHRNILEAVCNKEQEMAEYLTRIHIENSKNAYLETIQSESEKDEGP